jgi:hypothetical protein
VENQILDLVVVMPLSGSRSCCTAFAKTYTYEFSVDQRRNYSRNQAIGVFY